MKPINKSLCLVAGLLAVAISANAKEDPVRDEKQLSRAEMYNIVEKGLPEVLSEDNYEIAAALLTPRLGQPLVERFDRDAAVKTLFPHKQSTQEECSEKSRQCDITEGSAAGRGAFAKLSILHTDRASDIRFVQRPEQTDKFLPTELSDKQAYDLAQNLLVNTLGVPKEEIAIAPRGAKNPYPVKTVNMAFANGKGDDQVIPVEKLISMSRGLHAGHLGWVPGPGKLTIALNEEGVSTLAVRNWADMSDYGKDLDARKAKSRSQLVAELVSRFEREGITHLNSARSLLAISLPEGAESPVPVLRVYAAAQPRDLDESSQAKTLSTAGVVLELSLIAKDDDYSAQEQGDS